MEQKQQVEGSRQEEARGEARQQRGEEMMKVGVGAGAGGVSGALHEGAVGRRNPGNTQVALKIPV